MKVYQLNEIGLRFFIEKINEASAMKKKEEQKKIFEEMKISALDNSKTHSFPKNKNFEIDPDKDFATRWELAVYLDSVFKDEFIPPSVYNWLNMVYFTQFIKEEKNRYKISAAKNYYIKSKKNHRNILSFSHFVYQRFRELVKPLFLDNDCKTLGDASDQAFSFEYRNNKNFYELMNRLYLETKVDEHGNVIKCPKAKISGPLPKEKPQKMSKTYKKEIGNIRALKRFLVQLRQTHNLDLMTADDLYNLLPSNFDYYKNNPESDK